MLQYLKKLNKVNYKYFNKYSLKYQENLKIYDNPHSFYNEIQRKELAFKLIAEKMEEESKKIKKEGNKKRGSSVSPIQAIKTKIFNNHKQQRKISYQVGENYEPQKGSLNPINIKVNLRKDSNEH